jgi:hypothetical protein
MKHYEKRFKFSNYRSFSHIYVIRVNLSALEKFAIDIVRYLTFSQYIILTGYGARIICSCINKTPLKPILFVCT